MKKFTLFLILFLPLTAGETFTTSPLKINKQSPTKDHVAPPYRKEVIIIDPGHGGKDHGAKSLSTPTVLEKTLTLSCAHMIKRSLEDLGYRPILTRKVDHSLSLDDRVEFSKAHNPDLFVSIHFNSAPNEDAHGIEVYYFHESDVDKRSKASHRLAHSILNRSIEWTGAHNRTVKKGQWRVIKSNNVPAVLVEGGFLTNDQETQKLKNPYYIKRLGFGIAKGIDDYLTHIRSYKRLSRR